jgi:hypothetical protein
VIGLRQVDGMAGNLGGDVGSRPLGLRPRRTRFAGRGAPSALLWTTKPVPAGNVGAPWQAGNRGPEAKPPSDIVGLGRQPDLNQLWTTESVHAGKVGGAWET